MIAVTMSREGIGYPLLKWNRVIANTFLESKNYLKSRNYKYMLFAGWEVRMVKNCDRGLENTARGRDRGQYFQGRGHSFSPYGPTLS